MNHKSQTNPKSEIQNSKRIQNSEFKIQTDSRFRGNDRKGRGNGIFSRHS